MPDLYDASWKEAAVVVWENFAGVRGGGFAAAWRTLAFILLLAGTLFAVRCHARMNSVGRRFGEAYDMPVASREEDLLPSTLERARAVYSRRVGSHEFMGAAGTGGNLLGHPAGSGETPAARNEQAVAPEITVRGVMVLNGRSVAIVDISGEETGKVVKAGDDFACMGRAGRVLRVSKDGLSVRWNGLDWSFPIN